MRRFILSRALSLPCPSDQLLCTLAPSAMHAKDVPANRSSSYMHKSSPSPCTTWLSPLTSSPCTPRMTASCFPYWSLAHHHLLRPSLSPTCTSFFPSLSPTCTTFSHAPVTMSATPLDQSLRATSRTYCPTCIKLASYPYCGLF